MPRRRTKRERGVYEKEAVDILAGIAVHFLQARQLNAVGLRYVEDVGIAEAELIVSELWGAAFLLPLTRLEMFAIPMRPTITTRAMTIGMPLRSGVFASGWSGTVATLCQESWPASRKQHARERRSNLAAHWKLDTLITGGDLAHYHG